MSPRPRDLGYGAEEELLREGQLLPDHLLGVSPAPGQPFVLALDSRWLWRFNSIRFLLATDANVANRFVTVDYADAEGTQWASSPSLAVVAAGVAAQEFRFARRANPVSGIAGQPQFADLIRAWVLGGWQLRINVSGIQAGDQLSGIRLYVEKFEPTD